MNATALLLTPLLALHPDPFHAVLRGTHIGLGAVALVLFWVPALARKGGRLHVLGGRAFYWVALGVAATATVSCAWALVHPLSFSGIDRALTADETARLSGGVRFLFAILGTLMTWLVASVVTGRHVMRPPGDPPRSAAGARATWWLSIAAGVAAAAYGTARIAGGDPRGWLLLALGVFGVLDARKYLAKLAALTPASTDRWLIHLECMIGAGIAMYTAFFVFGFRHVSGVELSGGRAAVVWLIPAAIGIPATAWMARTYRKKLG